MEEDSSPVFNCSSLAGVAPIDFAFSAVKLLVLLPLSLLILCLGLRQRMRQRSFAATSNSDIFTFHSVALGLIYMLGAAFSVGGKHAGVSQLGVAGYYLCSVDPPGQTSFHILSCVERYLAVVHPVAYLRLKQSAGGRMRSTSIACVWLLCCGWLGVTAVYLPAFPYIPVLCILIVFLVQRRQI